MKMILKSNKYNGKIILMKIEFYKMYKNLCCCIKFILLYNF